MFTFECSLRIENPVLELNIYYKIVVGTVHIYCYDVMPTH